MWRLSVCCPTRFSVSLPMWCIVRCHAACSLAPLDAVLCASYQWHARSYYLGGLSGLAVDSARSAPYRKPSQHYGASCEKISQPVVDADAAVHAQCRTAQKSVARTFRSDCSLTRLQAATKEYHAATAPASMLSSVSGSISQTIPSPTVSSP